MILYQLRCGDEHSFEGWFRDSATYLSQSAAGEIECPYCGSTRIQKAPMAPSLAKPSGDRRKAGTAGNDGPEARAHEVAQQILEAAGQARAYVEENFEDVGDQFADEARRMHYGERDEGGIYGSATDGEEQDLEEEGIDFVRIPKSPAKNS